MSIPVPDIDQFTEEEGEEVLHSIGLRCFCHGADGQPDPNCREHENGGWLYLNEQPITGLVTAITQHRELMETGVFEPGDCVFSPTSDQVISEGDKITFTWPLPHGQGDVLVRGGRESEKLYYSAVAGLVCIDDKKVFYRQDIDYQLQGKEIVWTWQGKLADGKKPPYGTRYTIKYTALLEWIAFVPPMSRISAGENVGDKVMLRKKHLVESR